MRFIYWLFKKQIHKIAEELLKDLALDKYIEENFFIGGSSGVELEFRGKQFVKLMAAAVYELVKEAENYVTVDLCAVGYEPLTVVIQKKWKLSPHERAERLQKENELLKQQIKEREDRDELLRQEAEELKEKAKQHNYEHGWYDDWD